MKRGPSAGAPTQRERVLRRALAGRAVHQDDFWPGPAPDGGAGIRAVRSRISELEAEGYGFHHLRRPDGTIEYRLAHVPDRLLEPAPAPGVVQAEQLADEPARLFDPPAPGPQSAALRDWDEVGEVEAA